MCTLCVVRCVCGVLGQLAPVHRCARLVCCVVCVVSWATWVLFTDVHARCGVLRVRCPGPLGSCSPACALRMLCCVCGVLGLWARVHRYACSVCCAVCAVSWATWLLFTGVHVFFTLTSTPCWWALLPGAHFSLPVLCPCVWLGFFLGLLPLSHGPLCRVWPKLLTFTFSSHLLLRVPVRHGHGCGP